MSATPVIAVTEKSEVTIVTEVPPSLNKALLLMVKNFFSGEHYLLVYYIMRAVCIREENLRNKVNFDQKMLRQQIATLKQEKLVKERLLSQKNENGRTQSIIFYFINYRAIINVLKYKIDHMRQKLEAKEKEDVQKTIYRCNQCNSPYETLDVDRIFDMSAGILRCWRCQGEVLADESSGPSQNTRSLLARFNEQMLPLFASIRELAGIQLAPHLLEPDINQFLAEEDKNEGQQLVDFSQTNGKITLGGKAFAASKGSAGIRYAQGDQITVDLNADINSKPMEEAKQVPLWLQDDSIAGGTEHAQAAAALTTDSVHKEEIKPSTSVTINMLAELEGNGVEEDEAPSAKKIKLEEPNEDGTRDSGADEDYDDEEEEETIDVQGKAVPISEVTADMVELLTDVEKQKYVALIQELSMAY